MSNINTLEGNLLVNGLKVAIVCSRFNEFFVSKLLGGAIDTFIRHGGVESDITVAWVPGSYEIPLVAKRLSDSGKYDAVVALGVVIRGATSHADLVNSEVAKGLAQASMGNGVPIIYGVVTTENIEQAIERSGSKAGNRGASAMQSAIEMSNLMNVLPESK